MRLRQPQQMPLGRQDLPESVTERRTQITSLAGLLGDDQGGHGAHPDLNLYVFQLADEEYPQRRRTIT